MTDPDIQDVVDTTDWPPMHLQPVGKLQDDCKRLEQFALPGEVPQLQTIYDAGSYAELDIDQFLLMRELEVRARGG